VHTIGSKVKSIRQQHKLNQVQFADSIRISQGRLSEIEQGKTKPSAETLQQLRRQFQVDLNWLLDD